MEGVKRMAQEFRDVIRYDDNVIDGTDLIEIVLEKRYQCKQGRD